jgi:NADH-quinone oxidoreductase subunit J
MQFVLFVLLALGSILSALFVITTPSPIASALSFVVTLFCVAGLYALLAAPLVAAIQIIVYAGAVLVLILFVIMLLNLRQIEEKMAKSWKAAGIVVSVLLLGIAVASIVTSASLATAGMPPLPEGFGKVATFGQLLFTQYLYPFEVVSVLLLLAIVGAVTLIRKQENE